MTFIYEQRLNPNAQRKLHKKLWTACDVAFRSLEAEESRVRRGIPKVFLSTLAPQHLHSPLNQQSWIEHVVRDVLANRRTGMEFTGELLWIFVAHILILPTLSLQERARRLDILHPKLQNILMTAFLPSVFIELEHALPSSGDLDLDGHVFVALLAFLLQSSPTTFSALLGEDVVTQLDAVWSSLDLPPIDFGPLAARFPCSLMTTQVKASPIQVRGLLPFTHPFFDDQLAPVHVDAVVEAAPTTRMSFNTVFNDNYHWHNSRRSILPPHLGGEDYKPMDERQRRRKLRSDQRFMASLEWQAQTLTGAFGTPIQRQIILPVRSGKGSSKSTTSAKRLEVRTMNIYSFRLFLNTTTIQ